MQERLSFADHTQSARQPHLRNSVHSRFADRSVAMPRMLSYRILWVTLLVQGFCISGPLPDATSGERRAVLIGIDDYKAEGKLTFCVKDQSALKDRLERAGF